MACHDLHTCTAMAHACLNLLLLGVSLPCRLPGDFDYPRNMKAIDTIWPYDPDVNNNQSRLLERTELTMGLLITAVEQGLLVTNVSSVFNDDIIVETQVTSAARNLRC